jgi:hypothetical protein
VGDACVGSEVNCGAEGPLSTIEFFRGHGQFSGKTDALIRKVCTEAELTSPDGHSVKCDAALDKMAGEVSPKTCFPGPWTLDPRRLTLYNRTSDDGQRTIDNRQ